MSDIDAWLFLDGDGNVASAGATLDRLRRQFWRPLRRAMLECGVDTETYGRHRDGMRQDIVRYIQRFCFAVTIIIPPAEVTSEMRVRRELPGVRVTFPEGSLLAEVIRRPRPRRGPE